MDQISKSSDIAQLNAKLSALTSRIVLVEKKLENLRSHLNLVENSVIEKHKTSMQEIRSLQSDVRELRLKIADIQDLFGRLAKRMEDLASKEEVTVLERYIELIKPTSFVSREEVKHMIERLK